jgi:hypothetical protein
VLKIGGIISVVLALAAAASALGGARRTAAVVAVAFQVVVLVGAYLAAGRGSGSVHLSPWLYLLPIAVAITGCAVIAPLLDSRET